MRVIQREVLQNWDATVNSKLFYLFVERLLIQKKARLEDIFKNEEINTIIHTIGAGVGTDFKIEDSNYNRIIIMTDADTDGAHIQVLLLTFSLNI